MNYKIKSEYHVIDGDDVLSSEKAPALVITDAVEDPSDFLLIVAKDDDSRRHFGSVSITLHINYAEMLAQAILKKVKDIRDNV